MSFKKEIVKHLAFCDNYLDFKSFTNKTLNEWFEPLLDSFSDDGSLSYLIDEKGRYRASPLASTIEWLNEADLLPLNSLAVLQNRLLCFAYRNSCCGDRIYSIWCYGQEIRCAGALRW